MSEKETTQNKGTEKVVTKYDRKVQKRKEAEAKAKKQKKADRLAGIVIAAVIVLALLAIPVRKYFATHSTYITVGGYDITQTEFDYYYNIAKGDYLNTYGDYLSYMGLNINGDLSSQAYSDTMTWKDFFDQLAVESIKQNKALITEAKAAGFTYDSSAEYENFAKALKDGAAEAGQTLGKYYKATFGRYATASGIKPYIEEGYYASAYYKSVADTKKPSADEIQTFYNENKENYDSVDFLLKEIEKPKASDEETTEAAADLLQAAMDEAKKEADNALENIVKEGTIQTGMLKSAVSSTYSAWLFDEERAAGDSTIIEDDNKYYVLMFQNRYLSDAATANLRVISTTTGNGETILAELEAAGNTEEAFISLVPKYSEDTYSNTNGGLYEEMLKSSINGELTEWIYAEDRKTGDVTSIKKDEVTYVMYYLSEGRPEWQVKVENKLLSGTMDEYLNALKDACEVSDPKGKLVYLKVQDTDTAPEATDTEE